MNTMEYNVCFLLTMFNNLQMRFQCSAEGGCDHQQREDRGRPPLHQVLPGQRGQGIHFIHEDKELKRVDNYCQML